MQRYHMNFKDWEDGDSNWRDFDDIEDALAFVIELLQQGQVSEWRRICIKDMQEKRDIFSLRGLSEERGNCITKIDEYELEDDRAKEMWRLFNAIADRAAQTGAEPKTVAKCASYATWAYATNGADGYGSLDDEAIESDAE